MHLVNKLVYGMAILITVCLFGVLGYGLYILS